MTNAVLKKILKDVGDVQVSDEDYLCWKVGFESLQEHEKLESLLGVVSQYLLGGGKAGASVMAISIICISRWTSEKDDLECFFL